MRLSDRAIKRRAKRFLLRSPFDLFVPTLPGLERITGDELTALGYMPSETRGGVAFRGELDAVYEVNLALRSGNRVLLRLGDFLAQNYPMLYNRARNVAWEAILGNCPTYTVRVSASKSRLRHRRHVQSVVCEAIEARLGRFGLAPSPATDGLLTVFARLYEDRCTLSLDTTGTHLHKRGYRRFASVAPIRETTAAAILLYADSTRYNVVLDPFCGSGTLPIEAELICRSAPPGMNRSFAVENSPLHSPGMLRHKRALLSNKIEECPQVILGLDISSDAVTRAKLAVQNAGATHVSISRADARDLDLRTVGRSTDRRLIVSNLPYGRRLGSTSAARDLLEDFAKILMDTGAGWDYALVTPRSMPLEAHGLHPKRTLAFVNGGVPVCVSVGTIDGRR